MKICRTCGVCCLKTEMQLSEDDIDRIEREFSKQWLRDDFTEKVEEFSQLKNVEDHCIFFNPSSNECKIYAYCPKGCKFYPLIYNIDDNQCELDPDCPHRNLFYRHPPEYQKKCRELREWVKNELLKNQNS